MINVLAINPSLSFEQEAFKKNYKHNTSTREILTKEREREREREKRIVFFCIQKKHFFFVNPQTEDNCATVK